MIIVENRKKRGNIQSENSSNTAHRTIYGFINRPAKWVTVVSFTLPWYEVRMSQCVFAHKSNKVHHVDFKAATVSDFERVWMTILQHNTAQQANKRMAERGRVFASVTSKAVNRRRKKTIPACIPTQQKKCKTKFNEKYSHFSKLLIHMNCTLDQRMYALNPFASVDIGKCIWILFNFSASSAYSEHYFRTTNPNGLPQWGNSHTRTE